MQLPVLAFIDSVKHDTGTARASIVRARYYTNQI